MRASAQASRAAAAALVAVALASSSAWHVSTATDASAPLFSLSPDRMSRISPRILRSRAMMAVARAFSAA